MLPIHQGEWAATQEADAKLEASRGQRSPYLTLECLSTGDVDEYLQTEFARHKTKVLAWRQMARVKRKLWQRDVLGVLVHKAAVAKHHRLSDLEQWKFISHSFGGWEVPTR